MVDYKSLPPKQFVEELSLKIKNKEAKAEDVKNILKEAREEMPEDFVREMETTLHSLTKEMKELREALDDKDADSTGTGGEEPVSFFSKMNIFAQFVKILQNGGPYAFIALLVLSNAWTMMKLQEANNRIIDLLIALKVTGTVTSNAVTVPTPTPESTPHRLPPPMRRRLEEIRTLYEAEVQQQIKGKL